jgi:hypothetical protein
MTPCPGVNEHPEEGPYLKAKGPHIRLANGCQMAVKWLVSRQFLLYLLVSAEILHTEGGKIREFYKDISIISLKCTTYNT